MIHARHFSREQASAALPRLRSLLDGLRAARQRLTDSELHAALGEAGPTNGGGGAGRQVGEAFLEVRAALLELQEIGVVVRDIQTGLVDFPAIIEGREAYLCWRLDEPEIAFWHGLEAGFDGRLPLD